MEPELGARFTLTFDVDGHETTQTFTLSGWWEYDEAIVANHVLLPESRVDALLDEAGVNPNAPEDGMTGAWNLDVMLKSGSAHIERDMEQILAGHGFQSEDAAGEDYIRSGVNWGYTGAQLASGLDVQVVAAIAAVLLLILFTGYLIIYNVFQISVTNDIRFYGLLKTIGTTGRQLRRIIATRPWPSPWRGSQWGCCWAGWWGAGLTPAVIGRLNGVTNVVSVNPVLFAASAPVRPGDGAPVLPQAGPDGGKGVPCRGGALHREEQNPQEGRKAGGEGSLPALHGLGQPGPEPGQDGGHRALPVSGGGAAHHDGHLCQGLRHG